MFDLINYIIEDIYLILLIWVLLFITILRLLYYVGNTLFRIIPDNMMSILDAIGLISAAILIYLGSNILLLSTKIIYNNVFVIISEYFTKGG